MALLATAGLLLGASLFFSDGTSDSRISLIGSGAALVAAALVAMALWGAIPWPGVGREGLAFVGLAAGFVAWNGISVVWSAAPDVSSRGCSGRHCLCWCASWWRVARW